MPIMSRVTCEYCNTVLSSRAMLLRHQAKTKYCLEIRGLVKKDYQCTCGKVFSYKNSYTRHQKTCTFEPSESPSEDKEMVKEVMTQLLATLENLANKPTKVTNNTQNQNQIVNINSVDFEEIQEKFTRDIATANGEYCVNKMGISHANFVKKYMNDMYEIRDASRGKVRYIEDGTIVDDLGCRKFATIFYTRVHKQFEKHSEDDWSDINDRIQSTMHVASKTLDFLPNMEKAALIKDIQAMVKEASQGIPNALTKSFCTELVKN